MSKSRPSSNCGTDRDTGTATNRSLREARVVLGRGSSGDSALEDLVTLWRQARLRRFRVLDCHESGGIVAVEVHHRLPGERLAAIEPVDHWEHVLSTTDRERYVVEFTAPNFPPSLPHRTAGVIRGYHYEITSNGFALSIVGSHSAITQVVRGYEEAGLSPEVRQLGPYDGGRQTTDSLTERQREVITTAYEMGYYEVPRETTTRAVATALDVEASTVTEHLQRAERNLFDRHLSD